jgi:membrane protein YqaA with SNARE-associated domain
MRIVEKFRNKIQSTIQILQKFADRIWYPPFIGLLAALDNFVVIIPNDGILISSSMLTPRRWFVLALSVAIGSTIGSVILASLVESRGLEWILEMYPGVNQTTSWIWTKNFFDKYGLILVFAVAITPLMQQPVIIMASLAESPLILLAAIIFSGRIIKFLLMAYLGSHAPKYLSKLWGIKGELTDTGVDVNRL